jgi:NifU-like protein involved in Fe-S cluster formation
MELSDLYSDRILELAGNQPRPGRLADPDASARKVSRVCGSTIEVDINVADGVITGYGHDVQACALGQTSAAVVATHVVGTPVTEFRRVRD